MIINKTSNVVLLTTTNLLAILLTFPTNVAIAAPNCLDIINKGCASLPSTLTGKNKTCRITSAFGPMVSRCLSPGDFMFNKATTKHGKYQEPIRAICSGKVARTGFFLQGKEAYTVVTTHDFEEQCMFDGKKYDSFEIYYGHSDGGTSSVTVGSDVMAGDVFAYLNSCDTCKGMGPQSILMLLVKIGNVFVNPIALSHEAAAVEYTGSLARLDNSSPSPPVPPPLTLTLAGPCEAPSLNRYEIECGSKTFVFDMNHREGFSSEVNRSPPHTQDLNKPYFDQPRNPFSYGNNHTTRLVIPDDWIAGEASCNVVVKDIWGTTKWSGEYENDVVEGEEDMSGGQCPARVRSMSPFGQQFTGEVESVLVGAGLALSGNGRTMAVYSFYADIPDDDGHYRMLEESSYYENEWVQVYQMSNDNSKWVKQGKPVIDVGDTGRYNDGGARMIQLSSDGKTLGLRLDFSFRLLSYDDAKDEWVPIGSDINSKAFGPQRGWGFTFEMSADGRTMVVAWTQSRAMTARIFRYVDAEDKWIKLGDDISQSMSYGMVLSLSSDGRTFAASAAARTGVHVYSFDEGGNKWEKLGQTITTQNGVDISLSGNGRYLAVGEADESWGSIVGSARVYSFDENEDDWVMVGQKLEGKSKFDGFGVRVILSDNACSLAVSATAAYRRGEVLTFSFDGTEWKQRGDAVSAFGTRAEDIIAFSGDGSVVATTTVGSKTYHYGMDYEYIDGYVATYRTS